MIASTGTQPVGASASAKPERKSQREDVHPPPEPIVSVPEGSASSDLPVRHARSGSGLTPITRPANTVQIPERMLGLFRSFGWGMFEGQTVDWRLAEGLGIDEETAAKIVGAMNEQMASFQALEKSHSKQIVDEESGETVIQVEPFADQAGVLVDEFEQQLSELLDADRSKVLLAAFGSDFDGFGSKGYKISVSVFEREGRRSPNVRLRFSGEGGSVESSKSKSYFDRRYGTLFGWRFSDAN